MAGLPVYLEVGSKKVFACAVEWPGWARPARTEQEALEALAQYLLRYEKVVTAAGLKVPGAARRGDFAVLARLEGDATTDFGAPGAVPEFDLEPPTTAKWKRQVALLRGCWEVFDEAVAGGSTRLKKGPRGGGRDRDQVAAHVIDAEVSYARRLGAKLSAPRPSDAAGLRASRDELVARLDATRQSGPITGPRGGKGWPAAYAVRRLAWHVMDHAWEIEDKSEP